MKHKFDFVICDDPMFDKMTFRFYPKSSYVYDHTDNPPTTWKDVYKVYYSWAIIRHTYYNDKLEPESCEKIFYLPIDECSRLPELSAIIKNVIKTGETFDCKTIGQPAGEWKIEKKLYYNLVNDEIVACKFEVFNNLTDQGCRFWLREDKALEFCDWLDMVNQYMLKHNKGI